MQCIMVPVVKRNDLILGHELGVLVGNVMEGQQSCRELGSIGDALAFSTQEALHIRRRVVEVRQWHAARLQWRLPGLPTSSPRFVMA